MRQSFFKRFRLSEPELQLSVDCEVHAGVATAFRHFPHRLKLPQIGSECTKLSSASAAFRPLFVEQSSMRGYLGGTWNATGLGQSQDQ